MALTLVTSDLIHGLDYSKLTGTTPTWNQNTTGNAATATLAAGATILATARNIGGVSFNGSAAINLPGVNTAGNQNTSGNAGTVTNGVYTVGNQTIGGVKTFSSNTTFSGDIALTGDSKIQATADLGIGARNGTTNAGAVYIGGANDNPFISPTAFFATNGSVGIGTTDPQDKLEIKAGYLRMFDSSSTANAGYPIRWASNNGGTNVTYANITGITTSSGNRTGDLVFSTSSGGAPIEKMRISSGGVTSLLTNQAKTSTSNFEYALLGKTNEATNYGALQLLQKGGASNSVRSWSFQTIEAGVANAGNIIFQPSGGKVGIGTTSPAGYFYNGGGMGIYGGTTRTTLSIISNTFSSLYFSKGDGTSSNSGANAYQGYIDYQHSNNSLQFGTAQGERMRISSANGIASTTNSFHSGHDGSTGSSGAGTATVGCTLGSGGWLTAHRTNATCLYIGTTTDREVMAIFKGTSQAGKIRITGASTVAFESGSDYRLKEDLKDFNGLDVISKLKVYNFNWIGEDRRDHGLIAHEVQEVLPDLVSGEKDGVLDNGKIDKQTLDYGRFTPMLIKAMQEQQAQIELLKQEVELLKQ